MQDFNEYAKNATTEKPEGMNDNLFNLINSVAKKFDGKNQNELLMAIYKEAQKGKRNGTLTNAEIDGFANMLAPMLDDKKRAILGKLVEELKKI